uniref:Uncharacterized protein n=1 Tax=Oryza rufipogon TaxID=4529 RepID=A0A0E0NDW3_ORYRU
MRRRGMSDGDATPCEVSSGRRRSSGVTSVPPRGGAGPAARRVAPPVLPLTEARARLCLVALLLCSRSRGSPPPSPTSSTPCCSPPNKSSGDRVAGGPAREREKKGPHAQAMAVSAWISGGQSDGSSGDGAASGQPDPSEWRWSGAELR